jgi:osmotically-inducible protein OsmY
MIRPIHKTLAIAFALVVLGWAPSAFAQGARDAKLQLKASQQIYKDAEMINVEVQVFGGGMIYLRGTVATEETSKRAEELAKVKGAKDVRNRLKVEAIDVASASDDEIKAKIEEKIAADEDLSKGELEVAVTEGNVKVEGKVADYTVAGTLVSDIRKVDGVRSIDFENLKY